LKTGFIPISLGAYLETHLQANPRDRRDAVRAQLESALEAYRAGVRCGCGNALWVIGSAIAGKGCFTCITGETGPHGDFEIDEACNKGG
jgi:hypothetical protein